MMSKQMQEDEMQRLKDEELQSKERYLKKISKTKTRNPMSHLTPKKKKRKK